MRGNRDQIIAASEAWRAAEKAYRDELDKYVSAGWLGGEPLKWPEKPLTHEALRDLNRLRDAAKAAQQAYEDTLG